MVNLEKTTMNSPPICQPGDLYWESSERERVRFLLHARGELRERESEVPQRERVRFLLHARVP